MTRDMQIGLLLAVGFLALVGGVLYYRIDHPDELERYWNGPVEAEVAQQKDASSAGGSPGEGAKSTAEYGSGLPAAPAATAPALDVSGNSTPPALTTSGGGASSGVLPAAADSTSANSTAAGIPQIKMEMPPVLAAQEKAKEPAASPPESKSTFAGGVASSAPPPPSAPSLNLDIGGKAEAEKPSPSAGIGGATAAPPVGQPVASPPALSFSPPGGGFGTQTADKPKEEKKESAPPSLGFNPPAPPALGAGGPPDLKATAPAPGSAASSPPASEPAKSAPTAPGLTSTPQIKTEVPQSTHPAPKSEERPLWGGDISPAPAVKSAPLPKDPELKPGNGPGASLENKSPPVSADHPSSLWDHKPMPPAPQPGVTRNQETVTAAPATSTNSDSQYREYAVPRVGLGRPVAESVVTMNERRWSDSAGAAAPIIPSSTENRSETAGNTVTEYTSPLPQRRVTNDTRMRTMTVAQGETFSSLSQRIYGSEVFADALAAYNREEGFVKTDQPAGNQLVLLPDQLFLEVRYSNLLRKPGNRPVLAKGTAQTGDTPGVSVGSSGTAPASGPSYRVKKGEQLFDVAKVTLGDGYRWGEIYTLNKELLRDSTELRTDMVLRLPADAKLDGAKQR